MKRIYTLLLAALALLMTVCRNTGNAEIIYGDFEQASEISDNMTMRYWSIAISIITIQTNQRFNVYMIRFLQ